MMFKGGRFMASWFYASEGKQQGPFPEGQFRDLVAQGVVRPETLVWSEGMAGWQKAAEIPGLMAGGGAPPMIPAGGPPGLNDGGYGAGGRSLSVDFGILDFTWRTLVFAIGSVFIIPAPWLLVWYVNWMVSRVRVPGRPNLSFTGNPLVVAACVVGTWLLQLLTYLADVQVLQSLFLIAWFVLGWLFIRWFVANIASNGQPLGLSFSGSFWGYLGFALLGVISAITIIGWAWVFTAQMRWFCRNIQGTRRQAVFNGTGLEYLWRSLAASIANIFVIPIPWTTRWIMNWCASQTELAPRTAAF
jgi:hypothetical protein